MLKNAIVGQSGGPSAVINSTLAGVIDACFKSDDIGTLYGGRHGIEGMLAEDIIDLSALYSEDMLNRLKASPAMALGSCRFKLPSPSDGAEIYEKLEAIFKKYNIGYFFYIGGNDSMDTILKLSRYFKEAGSDIKFAGVPKTIDNDLTLTDHTPGFGSSAKYLATTMREIITDTSIYNVKSVTIVEIMGRNSGWLTLAASLPKLLGGDKPDLTYLPERPFRDDSFIEDIKHAFEKSGNIVVAVSEGLKDEQGNYVGSSCQSGAVDIFGHAYLSGVGKYLEMLVRSKLGCKVRSIELNLMQRCSSHLASKTDVEEAFSVGFNAVQLAVGGSSGFMACIKRTNSDPYSYEIIPGDIEKIANYEKLVPDRWLDLDDPGVKREIVDYILPLTKGDAEKTLDEFGLPEHFNLL